MNSTLDPKEIHKLIPLAHAFIEESGEDIPFNDEHFIKTWEQVYTAQSGSIIKYEKEGEIVGALGYLVYPDFLSGNLEATETFWFVRKEHRGVGVALLNEFERIARLKGVKRILMVHRKLLMPEKVSAIYLKKGYTAIETNYEKVL